MLQLKKAVGKVVGLLRLSPAIPFNVQNYLYGLTKVKFWEYVLTSWIAMMPGTFMYVYLGTVSGAALGGDREKSTAEWVLLAVGLLATIAVTVYVTKLAKSKLDEDVDADVSGEQSSDEDDTEASGTKRVGPGSIVSHGPGYRRGCHVDYCRRSLFEQRGNWQISVQPFRSTRGRDEGILSGET